MIPRYLQMALSLIREANECVKSLNIADLNVSRVGVGESAVPFWGFLDSK